MLGLSRHSFLACQNTAFWGRVSEMVAENIIIQNHLLTIFCHLHNVVSPASGYESTNGFEQVDLVY